MSLHDHAEAAREPVHSRVCAVVSTWCRTACPGTHTIFFAKIEIALTARVRRTRRERPRDLCQAAGKASPTQRTPMRLLSCKVYSLKEHRSRQHTYDDNARLSRGFVPKPAKRSCCDGAVALRQRTGRPRAGRCIGRSARGRVEMTPPIFGSSGPGACFLGLALL